ncbi:MAG: YhdH/YhfP family quinone oxidoreductase [Burkholderiaceae bacterium]
MTRQNESGIPSGFRAVRTHRAGERTESRLEILTLDELSAGDVVVRVHYAGVNYKDSLSLHGKARIITDFPRIAGIELVGEVAQSRSGEFESGQMVFVHGFQTGIAFDGGFAEYARVPAAHLQPIPAGLSAEQVAVLGVPAFTAAMALERFQLEGLRPGSGPVAISGAGGAVGLAAMGILARTGHQITAITRRAARGEALRAAGATEVLEVDALLSVPQRALEKARFAAAVDNVGGSMLAWLLRSTMDGACVACVGNAGSNSFDGSVLPFIMRAVKLVGIVANAPMVQRQRLWAQLASDWRPDFDRIFPQVHRLRLDDLLDYSQRQLAGETHGRAVVSFVD